MRRRILAILVQAIALLLVAACCLFNEPPVASFTALPLSGQAPLAVNFNASGSSDSDGSIVSYAWSFGDGGSSSGVTTNHTYDSAGSYPAQLTVTDNCGDTDTLTRPIQVSVPESFSLMTWNVRGYPENPSYPERREWFTNTIADYDADILCIQEINDGTADGFIEREYVASGFHHDTSDGFNTAVFFSSDVTASDGWPDPSGFQHPAQSAFFEISGLSGYVITFHFVYTDTTQRANERTRLKGVVEDYLAMDPDLIIAGDFNTTGALGDSIEELAESTGLEWIEPVNYGSVGTTYPGKRFDHILVSPSVDAAWDILATIVTFPGETINQQVSNHRPVYATFNEK